MSLSPSPAPSSSASGPASLGQMSSLSPECTPLKHRYDQCFNRWFEHYLNVTTPGSSAAHAAAPTASSSSAEAQAARRRSFWGTIHTSDDTSADGHGAAEAAADEMNRRRRLRDDLETQCGGLFGEYKGCVKKALEEKDILPLLTTARKLNPFPFPDASQTETISTPQATRDNEPFPFPQASKDEVRNWEKKEGW